MVSKRKLDPTNEKIGEEAIAESLIIKHSRRTKVKMAMVKAKKAITKEAHEAKKLAKLEAMAELSSTKKLPKTLKGNKEKTFGPLNPKSGEKGASIVKESSKREAAKDTIQVVEQLRYYSNSLESSKEENKNREVVNISKKPIKESKWMERAQKALEAQVVQKAQEAQAVK
ncbi:unnamed protein product [Sphagnum troendelagicum]|uniref:Uncharacterized protein n=1 Tax=Sphagnum troendelagicum TaxID=128251 RepID=A0ABP0TFI7_9BRYO